LADFVEVIMPSSIQSVTFTFDESSSTLYASVTLKAGVLDADVVFNQMLYYLTEALDVYPGTISWSSVPAKRQEAPSSIIINVEDEVTPTSIASHLASAGFLLVALLVVL